MPGSEERHKMTKWDNADDFHHYGEASRSSLEAAAEAAAKVNAMLIAKGKLKPSQLSNVQQTKQKASQAQTSMEMAEVEINDVPISCRNLLTRGSTQDEISKMSGAAVSTRGRFMSPEDRVHSGPGDRPLYLCVQGPSKDCVEKAVVRIREIIANSYRNKNPGKLTGPRPPGVATPMGLRARLPIVDGPGIIPTPPPLMSLNTQPPGMPLLQEKLFIGLEHAPPSFDVKNKILGPMGTYLQHIQTESGAKVMLHGKGSGFIEPTTGREAFEPMHILIQHPTAIGLQQAKQLSENLVQTVQQDYAQFQQALVDMSPNFTAGQPTPLLAGIQPQPGLPPPPSGTTWSLAQPPPGLPPTAASVAAPLPAPAPGAVQAIGPHPPHVTVSMSGPQPVGDVLSGAYTQSVPQYTRSVPQTVLINTSVPPPNFVPPPQTSTHSLPIGSSMALSQSAPPGSVVQQPLYTSNLAASQAPPPNIQAPPPGSVGATITSLPPAAQTNIVQVSGLPPQPAIGMMTQTILTQQPPPPQAETQTVVQHIPQITGPPQVVMSIPPPHNLHQQALPNMSQPPPNLSQPPPNLSQPPPNLSQPPPNLSQPPPNLSQPPPNLSQPPPNLAHQPLANLSQPPPNMAQPPPDMAQQIPNLSQPPPTLSQGPAHKAQPEPVTSVTGPNGQTYYKQYVQAGTSAVELEGTVSQTTALTHKEERPPHKRRFTEEKKEDKLPGNLLGYQHGPPHLANIVSSTSLAETGTSQAYVVVTQHSSLSTRVDSDRTLMPPPAPPLGKIATHEKQQLMPPPLPPFNLLGNEGPIPKKAKGALGNVSAKDDEDKPEVGQKYSAAAVGSLPDDSKKYSAVAPSYSPAASAGLELGRQTPHSVDMPHYVASAALDIQATSRLDPAGQNPRTSQYLASSVPTSAGVVAASPHSVVVSSSLPGTVSNLLQAQQYSSAGSSQLAVPVPTSYGHPPPPPPPPPPATSTPYQEVVQHREQPYTDLSHSPYAVSRENTIQPAYITGIVANQSAEQRRRVSYWS